MAIAQLNNTPPGTIFTYTLRKNGAITGITCGVVASVNTCADTAHSVSYTAGDTIAVQVQRTVGGGSLSTRVVVQLDTAATAALNASGGTGGIIIDNTATGGGSQVYFSTRTSPGLAVQASQAALQ